ncbi:MAG TPA: DUF4056 domain-containing protein [Methylomirabilota bacterium]|nr:DUF4056 domain-containing protein [Methylomirabilota bacterium]
MRVRPHTIFFTVLGLVVLVVAFLAAGRDQKWAMSSPLQDEDLNAAFFAGVDSKEIADVPEPVSLRPCCIFGNDVRAQLGAIPVPGYEITYTLELDTLGTHQFNKGTVAFEPRGGKRLLSDEVSGIVYTCRGGFIDVAHVRDHADRTLYLASQIARLAASGGVVPLTGEGAKRRVVVKPLDAGLVRTHGLRDVVVSLAEWMSFQAGIWHEITTWYGWASTRFSERPSAFSPEDLYSNAVGVKIAGQIIRRHGSSTELQYNAAVTAALRDALIKLGPLPQAATRRAFAYVDGIWWDSTKRVPDNLLVRHRNFNIGPTLEPWKLGDAIDAAALEASREEFDHHCRSDWKPFVLTVPDRLGDVPFRQMATMEIEPEEVLVTNGFPFPRKDSAAITQDDFPSVISAVERAADAELGPGAGKPAARPGEKSRYTQSP